MAATRTAHKDRDALEPHVRATEEEMEAAWKDYQKEYQDAEKGELGASFYQHMFRSKLRRLLR